MPFPDEPFSHRVEVVAYRDSWAAEGSQFVACLHALLPSVVSVEHIGSTAVPGLAAKDCLDVMIQVHDLATAGVADVLQQRGYRRRPEPWNQEEVSYGTRCRKQVFAPPAGARSSNIHVRDHGSANVRYALLFRDYLTDDQPAARAWGRFKIRLAQDVTDLAAYGQIKARAQEILMQLAENWSHHHGWQPSAFGELDS